MAQDSRQRQATARRWTARLLGVLAWLCLGAGTAWAQGPLTNGGNHAAAIASPGEIDEWTFDAVAGDSVLLSVGETASQPDPNFVPWIRLRQPNGSEVASAAGLTAADLSLTLSVSGTYTVSIRDSTGNRPGTALGSYVLYYAKVPGGSIVPAGDDGGPLTSGAVHAGHIGGPSNTPGDLDVWTFTAAQHETFLIGAGKVPVGGVEPDLQPWVRVYGPTGAFVGQDAGVAAADLAIAAPLSGTYTVIVSDWTGNREPSHVGDYTIHLVRGAAPLTVSPDDEGGPLTNGAVHGGRIGAPGATPLLRRGELDAWTFTAAQNEAFVVGVGEVLDSEIDPDFQPWVRVYGPTGGFVGSAAGVLAADVEAVAPLSGTYTVVVSDWTGNREPSHVGDYTIHLVRAAAPLTVSPDDEGGALTNGANQAGRIGAPGAKPFLRRGDLDAWTLSATLGDQVVLSVGEVLDSEVDPDFQPWVRVYGPGGAFVASAAGVLASDVQFNASLSGTYTVVVSDWTGNREPSHVGDYLIHLFRSPATFTVPVDDDGGALTSGVARRGRIGAPGPKPFLHRADLDPWSFQAAAGAAVSVSVAEVDTPVPDPDLQIWVRLFGPLGNQVWQAAGANAATINITAPVAGRYVAVVSDWTGNREPSHVGDYSITVSGALAPSTTAGDAYTTPMNTTLAVPAPGVLANDQANGGGPLTAELVTTVGQGLLTLNANGSFTFVPASGFTGQTSFTYRSVGLAGPGNTVTVTLTVTPVVPTAVTDAYALNAGTTLTVPAPGVLQNDASNGGGTLSAQLVSAAAHGTVTLAPDGGFTYAPVAGFAGGDSFVYRAVTGGGAGSNALVSLQVNDLTTPQPPTGLYVSAMQGTTITLRWTPPSTGAAPTGYVLEGGLSAGDVLGSLPANGTTPLLTVTLPAAPLYLRIHTIAGGQRSAASNEVLAYVGVPAPPSPPATLLGTASGASLALAWRPTFQGGAPGSMTLDVSGPVSASLPLGLADTFRFDGVPPGTYVFSVRATNAAGASGPSNTVSLAFPAGCTGAPAAPDRFLAYREGSVLSLVWDPPASGPAPTSYLLTVSGAFGGSFLLPGRGISAPVGPGTYQLSVAAVNACGQGPATAVQAVVVP